VWKRFAVPACGFAGRTTALGERGVESTVIPPGQFHAEPLERRQGDFRHLAIPAAGLVTFIIIGLVPNGVPAGMVTLFIIIGLVPSDV
jgi:hypothetical protein